LAWPPPETRIDAEVVKREATAYMAAVAAGSNTADMAANMQRVRCIREEDRRVDTRKTYSKCWRLWKVSILSLPPPRFRRRR
jgi:hypothetical protein